MFTYKSNTSGNVKVYLDKKQVGTIRRFYPGFAYFPKGSSARGEIFRTIDEVKRSIEGK